MTTTERRSADPRQRVFIVDDHPLVREWLANVINQQWDLTVCGESEGRENCLEAIEKKKPHVAVVDISLKDSSGFDLIAEIKQRVPACRNYRPFDAQLAALRQASVSRRCQWLRG